MGGSCDTVHPDVIIVLHHVPIHDPFFDSYHLTSHTWGRREKYELAQRIQKVLADLLVFHLELVLLENFVVNVNGFI